MKMVTWRSPLSASQAALATVEGETNAVRVQLVAFNARVVGKFFEIILYFDYSILPNFSLTTSLFLL